MNATDMDATVCATTRSSVEIGAADLQVRTEAETLSFALRADLRSRDERTARLRAMILASGLDAKA
jgi:hypothetical protein